MTSPREGVVRFEAAHHPSPPDPAWTGLVGPLLAARQRLAAAGLLGQHPGRYEGAGFGNVSLRVPGGFLITGTQTGGLPVLSPTDLCLVTAWDPAANRVESRGPAGPSSEAMTHGAVYEARPEVACVLHGHSPALWQAARRLGLPVTDPAAEYGTPALYHAVRGLAADGASPGVCAMGGHQDGVLAWGTTVSEAEERLWAALRGAAD